MANTIKNMRTVFFISVVLLLFLLYKGKAIKEPGLSQLPQESSFIFQLPEKSIFVKTTKYKGGKFDVSFAPDSLSLNDNKDYIEFKTGSYIQIIIDSFDIYLKSRHATVLATKESNFNIKVVSEYVFDSFFENGVQKYPYSFINIDTKEYNIGADRQIIKTGDIHGGW